MTAENFEKFNAKIADLQSKCDEAYALGASLQETKDALTEENKQLRERIAKLEAALANKK